MINFTPSDRIKKRPEMQLTSMIDIMFINLLFFMSLFVYFHFESQLNISVPKAQASTQANYAPEDLIINITKDGTVVVNQKNLKPSEVTALLSKTTELYPNQSVIVRADENTYHKSVVRVLDACAKAKIWNISFATAKEK